MGWEDIMMYTVNGQKKHLTTQFGEIKMTEINIEWQALANLTDGTSLTRKLKQLAMYTWLLNSMDQDFKKFLTQNTT